MSDISKKKYSKKGSTGNISNINNITTTIECPVCLENLPSDAFVVCLCDSTVCKPCSKEYILNSTITAHCMQCKVAWSNKFIATQFSKAWLDDNAKDGYRTHRKKCALEREKSMIPETLLELPRLAAIKEKGERIAALRTTIKDTKAEIQREQLKLRTRFSLTQPELCRLRENIKTLKADLVNNKNTLLRISTNGSMEMAERVGRLICPCPSEGCRGMINSLSFKCVVCSIKVCKRCREIKPNKNKFFDTKPHVCNKDTLENLELLRDDTKPCPNCAVAIFKIEGCFDPATPTLLYDRSVILASEVKVGMNLMGDDDTPRRVKETFAGEDEMFKVLQGGHYNDYIVSQFHTLVLLYDSTPIEMTVRSYMSLSEDDKQFLKGYKTTGTDEFENAYEAEIEEIDIAIIPLGRGPYVGWNLNKNHRFIAPDFTVLRNCDQMWCTQCKTAFSWDTGAIETGRIHNPHALRWQREHTGVLPREIEDVPCGGLPEFQRIIRYDEVDGDYGVSLYEKVMKIYQVVAEIDAKIRKCIQKPFNDLRADYVLKKKNEKQWESAIFTRERTNERKQTMADILVTFRTIANERFRELQDVVREKRMLIAICRGSNHYAIDPLPESEETKSKIKTIKCQVNVDLKSFIQDMNDIRKFINGAITDELPLLGTPNPVQILSTWVWADKNRATVREISVIDSDEESS